MTPPEASACAPLPASIEAGPPPPINAASPERAAPLKAFAVRWFMAYLFLHIFPFPLDALPLTGWFAGLYAQLMRKVVPWAGKLIFGLHITIFPGGSGDTTYNTFVMMCR